jgi:hypothetical protein
MMGGYLQRVVESGMTSLRDVRGSILGAPVDRDREEQQAAAPFERDEAVSELTRALPVQPDARPDPGHPSASLPPDLTSAPRDAASYNAPATHVQPLAHPASDMASPTRPREAGIEERRSHEPVLAMPQDARGTGADAPSLKDAGIRSVRGVLSRDEVPSAKGAQGLDRIAADDGGHDQRATSRRGRTSAADGERLSPHPGVSAARVEQWTRLKDRLLIEHFPGTSNSKVPVEGAEHNVSPPTNMSSTRGEIVIEQLEVVVAAPHPASPPPAPGRSALPPRSGAWSVATRRYLGKL